MRTISLLCLLSTVWLFLHSAAAGDSGQYAGPAQPLSPLQLVSRIDIETFKKGQSVVPGDGFLLDDIYFPQPKSKTALPKTRNWLVENKLPKANPDRLSVLSGLLNTVHTGAEDGPVARQIAKIMGEIADDTLEWEVTSHTSSSMSVDASFSKDVLEESRRLAIGFSARYGIASASASMEKARRDLSEKSVFYIAWEELGRGNVALKDAPETALDDAALKAIEAEPDPAARAQKFLGAYGSHYVDSVGYGFRLFIRVTAEKKEEEDMKKLAASIRVSGFGGSAETSVSQETRNLAAKINCDYTIGFSGQAVPEGRFARMASLEDVYALLKDIREGKISILPVPISYTLASYYELLGEYPKLQEIFTNNAVKTPIVAKAEYGLPIGTVLPYGGMEAPHGYLLCDGSLRDRREYDKLFEALGNTYGPKKLSDIEYELTDNEKVAYKGKEADLPYLFRLPDLRGNYPEGAGRVPVGTYGGEAEHTLAVEEMPAHKHDTETFSRRGYPDGSGDRNDHPRYFMDQGADNPKAPNGGTMLGIKELGGGQPHNNLPPYVTVNYIIKY